MTKANTTLVSFTRGELSRKLRGRVDKPQYYAGAERMENFIAQTQGPARFRQGTGFVAETKDNQVARLIQFQFNDEQSYILEFTDQLMRVYLNEGLQLEPAQDITNITQANPAVVTYDGADNYDNGKEVFISGVAGMTEINGQFYTIQNINAGANTFELAGTDSSGFGAYTSGGTVEQVVEVVIPYTVNELFDIQVAQNADTMYITHPLIQPHILSRTGATTWNIAPHAPAGITLSSDNAPRAVTFYEQRLVYAGSNNNPQGLFFSKAGDFDDFTVGTNDDDGLQFIIGSREPSVIRWMVGTDRQMVIGTFGGNYIAKGGEGFEPITPTNISIRPTGGIGAEDQLPVLHNNRVLFTERGQRTLRIYQYSIESDGFQAVDLNVESEDITEGNISQIAIQLGRPQIIWASKENGELIGLTFKPSQEVFGWHRHNTREGDKITSIAVNKRPADFDQLWMVVERQVNGVTKRYVEFLLDEPVYPDELDFFTGSSNKDSDMTNFNNVLFERQKEYVHLDSSLSYNGTAVGVGAGASLTPAAVTGTSITFTASTSVFTAANVGREIWKKHVDGSESGRAIITGFTSGTVVTCDIIQDFDSTDAMAAGDWFLTSDTLTGLDHLEGEVVNIVADGSPHPDRTVSDGQITLDAQSSVVHVGFKYTGILKTMNLEVGGINGPAQTKYKNIYRIGIQFENTLGVRFGTTVYNTEQINFRSTNSIINRPPELFSGEKLLSFADRWQGEKHVLIVQDLPLPCTVQMLVPYSSTSN